MILPSAATGYDVQFVTEGIFRFIMSCWVLKWQFGCADWECGAQISL
jgi:hypothetical protein